MSRFPSIAPASLTAIRYRVEAEWPGGGVSKTIPADSEAAAQAWGAYKARGHADASVSVTPRGLTPADLQLAAQFAGEAGDLVLFQGYVGGLPE